MTPGPASLNSHPFPQTLVIHINEASRAQAVSEIGPQRLRLPGAAVVPVGWGWGTVSKGRVKSGSLLLPGHLHFCFM